MGYTLWKKTKDEIIKINVDITQITKGNKKADTNHNDSKLKLHINSKTTVRHNTLFKETSSIDIEIVILIQAYISLYFFQMCKDILFLKKHIRQKKNKPFLWCVQSAIAPSAKLLSPEPSISSTMASYCVKYLSAVVINPE